MEINKIRKHRFSPADAATSLNLVCGLLSMVMAAHDQPVQAIWLIVMAMVFDSVDGNLAKMFHSTSDFGKQLDSLADMVSFGVAPSFLFAETLIQPSFSFIAFLAPAAYTVCAAVRLARFNIHTAPRGYFQGVPSPAAALSAIMFLLAAIHNSWTAMPIFPGVALSGLAMLAVLMVSPIFYPKPFSESYVEWKPYMALSGTLFLLTWAIFGREAGFLALMLSYVIGAPFYGLALRHKEATALH